METIDSKVDSYWSRAIEGGRRLAELPFDLMYRWVIEYEGNELNFKRNAIATGICTLVDIMCYMKPGSQLYASIPATIGALIAATRAAKDKNVC